MIDINNLILKFNNSLIDSEYKAFYNPYTKEYFEWNEIFNLTNDYKLNDYLNDDSWIEIKDNHLCDNLIKSYIDKLDENIKNKIISLYSGKNKYNKVMKYLKSIYLYDNYIKYKDKYIESIAINWCKIHNISYK